MRLTRIKGEFPPRLVCIVTDPHGANFKFDFLESYVQARSGPNTAIYPADFLGAPQIVKGRYNVTWIDADYKWLNLKKGRAIASDSFVAQQDPSNGELYLVQGTS